MKMRQRARVAAIFVTFALITIFVIAALLGACTPPHSNPYYVSKPAHTYQTDRTWPVALFVDDRTLVWMDGAMDRVRRNNLEGGACARVAKTVGDGVFIDSLMPARGALQIYTPTFAHFGCYNEEVPIHWHPDKLCWFSDMDVEPSKSVFPAIVMMCGMGIDSVYAVKVRP